MSPLRRWLPVVAWSALILMTSSDLFSAQQTGSFLHHLIGWELPQAVNIGLRKLMHLVGYGILGALAYRATRIDLPRRPIVAALCVALLVSGTDELHQRTTALRTGSGWDVLLDLVGAAIAIWSVRRMTKYRQEILG
jgi:VanZ family protein